MIASLAAAVERGGVCKRLCFTVLFPLIFGAALSSGVETEGDTRSDYTKAYLIQVLELRIGYHGAVTLVSRVFGEESRFEKILHCRSALLPWRNVDRVSSGQIYFALLSIKPLPEEGGYREYLLRQGVSARCTLEAISESVGGEEPFRKGVLNSLTSPLSEQPFPQDTKGMLRALALGDRSALSRKTENAFRVLGLSHILVVSGYHLGLLFTVSAALYLGVFSALYGIIRTPPLQLAQLFSLLTVAVYIWLIDPAPSNIRAFTALFLWVLIQLGGRAGSVWRFLMLSVAVVFTIWPKSFFDLGVQLSVSALASILAALEGLTGASWLRKLVAVQWWASCATSAVLLCWFERVYPLGFLGNLLFGWPLALVGTLGGGLSILLAALPIPFFDLPQYLVLSVLNLMRRGAWELSGLPFHTVYIDVPWNYAAAALLAFAPVGLRWFLRRR